MRVFAPLLFLIILILGFQPFAAEIPVQIPIGPFPAIDQATDEMRIQTISLDADTNSATMSGRYQHILFLHAPVSQATFEIVSQPDPTTNRLGNISGTVDGDTHTFMHLGRGTGWKSATGYIYIKASSNLNAALLQIP